MVSSYSSSIDAKYVNVTEVNKKLTQQQSSNSQNLIFLSITT